MNDMQTLRRFDAAVETLRAFTFKAWRGNTPVADCPGLAVAQTFDEAVEAVTPGSGHKTVISVLMDHAGRREKELRLYVVKRSTKRGSWRAAHDGGRPVFEGKLEPHLLHAMAVDAFEPTRPFDPFRDDAVGVDRHLVEARS